MDPLIAGTWDFAAGEIIHALGEPIVWDPGGPHEKDVRAIFGNGFQRVESGGVRIASRNPEIMVRLSDLPSPPQQGGRVGIRGQAYAIASVQPDVEGVSATLRLKVA